MATNPFADLQELASLRLTRKYDELAQARLDAFREIRERAGASGLTESSGVVWGQKLDVIREQSARRALAVAQTWHDLIRETRDDFSDTAHAFVRALVEQATEVPSRIEVDGAQPPPGIDEQFAGAVRNAALAAKLWLSERREEARLHRQRSKPNPSEALPERRDGLTGLLDRGSLDAALLDLAKIAVESGDPLSMIMIDLDRFKAINDTHGHQTGDKVLSEAARRVGAASRSKGAAFRYGGEEIVVLLPNHTCDEAVAVAERVRRAIEATPVGSIEVTASLGVSTIPDHAADAATLVSTADRAMYDAKALGRNLVRIHGEAPPSASAPRVVERKQPRAGWLTDEQRKEMRQKIVRGVHVECPNDGAPLTIHDATHIGSRGKEFLVSCPDCGRHDKLPSPH